MASSGASGAGATRRLEERLARRGGVVELLRLPSALFAGVAGLRNACYDRGLLPSARVDTPVVSVGNISVGGTGKTPMVALLARELLARGRRPGLLSRGYRRVRAAGEAGNDEARLLARLLPDLPHVQTPDRVAGAHELEARGVDAIVLDDGFQHRRLARDLDLVLVDATRPWGLPARDGHPAPRALLPRGLLREPPAALARADALVLTRCEQVEPEELAGLEAELLRHAPGRPVLHAAHRPTRLRAGDEELPLEALRGRAVVLASGLANPEAFERTARALGADVRGVHAFPDHHAFRREELAPLAGAGELLVTSKDAVKLAGLGLPFLELEVELELLRGAAVLAALLDALPPGRRGRERAALHEGLHG